MSFRSTASIAHLRKMAELQRTARSFFDSRDFFEVSTPVLSHDVLVDLYVEPISVPLDGETLFLQTSPEFAMKRLLACGAERIYQIAHAFRRHDRGLRHNVEFTLLEWYRAGDGYNEGMDLLADLAETLLNRPRPEKVPFAEPFREITGLDVHRAPISEFQRAADRLGVIYPMSFLSADSPASRDDWIDLIFADRVESTLGNGGGVILYDYPAAQSQLARTREVESAQGAYEVTERFELYADGVELANGYNELLDAGVLRERFRGIAMDRKRLGMRELPGGSRLLEAMEAGLPTCSGCALGMERALMVREGLRNIEEVIPFPIERA